MRPWVLLGTISALLIGAAVAQQAPPSNGGFPVPAIAGGFPTPQKIEGVPPFRDLELKLGPLPKARGARVSLFNGRDLDQFTPWLGYANGTMFPSDANDKPLGETGIGDAFQVAQLDGKPVIYVPGRIWGSLNTKRDFGDCHLSLWYRFGKQWGTEPPNTGVLYHSYGPHGAFAGTWMSSIEFEIKQGLTGMVATIGKGITAEVDLGKGPGPGLFGFDDYRYMPGGKRVEIRLPTMVKQPHDVELPVGQWNKVDLYVAGDRAVQVINGKPTMALSGLKVREDDGSVHALTRGLIQFESEGTEVYFRDLWLEPIASVPEVVVVKRK